MAGIRRRSKRRHAEAEAEADGITDMILLGVRRCSTDQWCTVLGGMLAVELPLKLVDFVGLPQPTSISMPTSPTELAACAARVGRDVAWSTAGAEPALLRAERTWRALMMHSSLRVTGNAAVGRLSRTSAFESMDASEKGAESFFLGQALAKHVAEKLFGCVVFAHLDAALRAAGLAVHGSRPDFVGLRANGSLILVEAKGRTSSGGAVLVGAKAQIAALAPSIPADLRYGSLSYFTPAGRLRVTLRDPDGSDADDLDVRPAIASYYGPLRVHRSACEAARRRYAGQRRTGRCH